MDNKQQVFNGSQVELSGQTTGSAATLCSFSFSLKWYFFGFPFSNQFMKLSLIPVSQACLSKLHLKKKRFNFKLILSKAFLVKKIITGYYEGSNEDYLYVIINR